MACKQDTKQTKAKPSTSKVEVGGAVVKRLERTVFDSFVLSQLGKSLLSLQDMGDLAEVLVCSVHEASDAQSVALLIYNDDSETLSPQYSLGLDENDLKKINFKKQEGTFWRVLHGGEPFPIRDSSGSYRFGNIVKESKFDYLHSKIWVPLVVKNGLRGVLTLGPKKDGAEYDQRELTFITQLAAQAAIAIDIATVGASKRETSVALKKKMESLSVLYDVSKILNLTNDFKKTLLLILDKSRNAVHAQKGSIMLLNKDTQELEIAVVRGIDALIEKRINDNEIQCAKIKVGEGVAGKVAKTKKLMIVDNAKDDNRFVQSDTSNVDNIVCSPLIVDNECIGVMNITNKINDEKFDPNDTELLTALAGQVAVMINNVNLYHLAITDGLTKLYIKRYFDQALHAEMVRCQRYKRSLSLIMMDIDYFKKCNDTYGHQQGDIILGVTANLLKANIRETDVACRYGGEEFVIVLPETDKEEALGIAEKLRGLIEEYNFPLLKGGEMKITVSLGIASYPDHADSEESIVKKSDLALYACKSAGRNCAKVYSPEMKD